MLTRRRIALFLTTILIIGTLGSISYAANSTANTGVPTIDQEETRVYAYNELVDLAKKNSRSLASQRKKIERSEIIQEEAARNKTYTPIGHGTTMEEAAASAALQGLVAANTGLAMAKKQLEVEEDKIAYNVKKAMDDLILAKIGLANQYLEKEILDMEAKHGNIQYVQGLISKNDFEMINESLVETMKKVGISEAELDNAYLKLNDLIGLDKAARYDIRLEEANDEREIPSLEIHIRRMLSDNPNIWMLEQNAKLADISLSLYTYNVGLEPYSAMEIDAITSKMALGDAKEVFELSLRNLHHGLEKIQESLEVLEINRKKLERNLNINKIMLQEGMATPLEVKKLEKTLKELENQKLQLEFQYEETLMMYEKPWIASN